MITDPEIVDALSALKADGRRMLRKYLIADEHDRKGLLIALYRNGQPPARPVGDLVEMLDEDPDARRRVTRILGEMAASED